MLAYSLETKVLAFLCYEMGQGPVPINFPDLTQINTEI